MIISLKKWNSNEIIKLFKKIYYKNNSNNYYQKSKINRII